MQEVIFLLFRRMRAPLLVLIGTYAVAVLGLTLVPGRDDAGDLWYMDFFHAFYVVTYTGPTIGFGEIPYAFTGAQRLWMMFAIYATVIAWLYAIGALLAVLQDPAFRRVVGFSTFRRSVRRLAEPFYIICGYGEGGTLLVRALADEGIQPVVMDRDQDRIDTLKVEGLGLEIPGIQADAADPEMLVMAGLKKRECAGVIAVSQSEQDNLSIAIACKLLAPRVPVICRARYRDTEANLASFGTEHIINPFDTFAERFAMSLRSPAMYLVYAWLTGIEHQPVAQPMVPPRGTWVVCGFGRFGKAMRDRLHREGAHAVLVEADPEGTGAPLGTVIGRGTEAETLEKAKIHEADGIIAGTDNDANNLSIILTARQMNPGLFTVARQNRGYNQSIFDAANLDLVMNASNILTREVLGLITTPLLSDFLRLAAAQDDDWANVLISRMSAVMEDTVPDTWTLDLARHSAPAALDALAEDRDLRLRHLLTDPRDRESWLPAVPLLLYRGADCWLLPDMDTPLRPGDRLLFCGSDVLRWPMERILSDHSVLAYVRTGVERPGGWLWQWLERRNRERAGEA
ncbi:potassium channel family protein [Thiohalorhabdus sp. Cl-TMA]|uniref:TrkA family potassium uptake protein n=1 Tax=Thiohalorhabdus methylotrophus TaxID=3242694 RepID=A0ABV4TXN3_9GAMM